MSRITYELFENDAEISGFTDDGDIRLKLEFGKPLEGLVSVEGVVSRVIDGSCSFDTRLIDSGEHQPILILRNETIRLPKIIKSGGRVRPASCTDEYTRTISLRERHLSMRVEALERELRSLEGKISRRIF